MKKIAFLILLQILLVTSGQAKCPTVDWHVTGKIITFGSEVGIEGVKVFVFFDESKGTNVRRYVSKNPDFLLTNSEGIFEGLCFFDTFEYYSPSTDHICTKKPTKVELIFIRDGYLTKKIIFSASEFIMEKDAFNLGGRIILPDIALKTKSED